MIQDLAWVEFCHALKGLPCYKSLSLGLSNTNLNKIVTLLEILFEREFGT